MRDLNPQLPACKADTLPIELMAHIGRQGRTRTYAFPCERVTAACSRRCATCRYVVGVERLELPTFRSQAGRSSQTELRSDVGVTDGA